MHLFVANFGDDIEFEGIDEFDNIFEDREVAIDDGIEEAVEEVVQIGVCDFATLLSEALSEGFPAVTWAFLEGDQDVAFEVDRDLFRHGRIRAIDHSGDDEESVFEFFDFGSLVDVHHVFDDEGVELEEVREVSQG
jgi:hypothetical protein